jgi:hypothetical protein
MTDQTGRDDRADDPQDGAAGRADQVLEREDGGSVLSGFSWDDPAGGAAPTRADDETSEPTPAEAPPTAPYPASGSSGSSGSSAYQPGAYPAAGGQEPSSAPGAPSDPYASPPSGGSGPSPSYGQSQGYGSAPSYGQPSQWYGQSQPYGQSSQPYGQPADPYGSSQPYGAPPSSPYGTPPAGSQPYGTAQPYGGYPPAYPPPGLALDPEQEKARSSAVLWTILNGVAIFLCGNLLAIGGVICAAIAIGKAREDVAASRNLTKWSWILFAVGFALGAIIAIAYVVFVFGVLGTSGAFTDF